MDSIVQKEDHRAGMLKSKHESLHRTLVPVSIVFEMIISRKRSVTAWDILMLDIGFHLTYADSSSSIKGSLLRSNQLKT